MKPDLEHAQHSFIKLLVCMQAGLELMDDLEGTTHETSVDRWYNETFNTKEK